MHVLRVPESSPYPYTFPAGGYPYQYPQLPYQGVYVHVHVHVHHVYAYVFVKVYVYVSVHLHMNFDVPLHAHFRFSACMCECARSQVTFLTHTFPLPNSIPTGEYQYNYPAYPGPYPLNGYPSNFVRCRFNPAQNAYNTGPHRTFPVKPSLASPSSLSTFLPKL